MEYKIALEFSRNDLEDLVHDLLKEGWSLVGGVAVDGNRFYQAMSRV